MRHFLKLTDYSLHDMQKIFKIANYLGKTKPEAALKGKTLILFFPESGIRERVSFEKGISILGGQAIVLSNQLLDKNEEIKEIASYLNEWADSIIIRHDDMIKLDEFIKYARIPVFNAMTSENHPCEPIADLYAISKLRENYRELNYLYVGSNSNIGRAWKEAVDLFGLNFRQCCPLGHELDHVEIVYDINDAIKESDIVITDFINEDSVDDFEPYKITKILMDKANKNALVIPYSPFISNRQVSEEIYDSEYFAGYSFKKELLYIHQALMLYCMDI